MKVLVNAVSVREGGPLVVLQKLLAGMLNEGAHTWIVASGAPSSCMPSSDGIISIDARVAQNDPLRLLRWYEIGLPRANERWKPDVVFSMTNYLPIRSLQPPTVLLEQHAGHFSREFESLTLSAARSVSERLSWHYKSAWVRRSVRAADLLLVQTASLADRIKALGLRKDRIFVVPHGPGNVSYGSPRSVFPGQAGTWRLGYISKFGVQKDFDVLFRAAKALSRRMNIKLVLTLDPANASTARVLCSAQDLGVSNLIENHGETRGEHIMHLYDSLDIMVFCSTCESFGFPMVEAMARGIPIVVADTPENREITATASLRFRPHDESGLTDQLMRIMMEEAEFRRRSETSLVRGHAFSWTRACKDTLSVLDQAAGGAR